MESSDLRASGLNSHSLPIPLALGLALGFFPGQALAPFALGAAVVLVSCAAVFGGGPRHRRSQAIAAGLGLVAGVSLSWYEAGSADAGASMSGDGRVGATRLGPVWVEGRLQVDSRPTGGGFRYYAMRVERRGLAGRGVTAELSYPGGLRRQALRALVRSGPEIDAGSLIRVPARSRSDDGSALFAQAHELELVDRGGGIEQTRSSVRAACRRALARVGARSAGLIQALVLGVRDSLAPEEAEAFKSAGCAHILALSGEHLSVLGILAIALLRPLLGPIRARLGGAILAVAFMWIAGPGPSLARAVLMMGIGAVALAIDRPQTALHSLSLAFIALLLLDPSAARGLGFSLSFLAVWGLAVLGPRFAFALGKWLPPVLLRPATASLSAQTAVSPLLAFGFGYLQFAGILASMAAGPLVMLLMWWAIGAAALCAALPAASALAAPVSDLLYRLLMGVMEAAGAAPRLILPSLAAQAAASAAVVGLAALVYARPHAEYRASGRRGPAARLRLASGSPSPPRR